MAIALPVWSQTFLFADANEAGVPEALRDWIPWVLDAGQGGDRRACPSEPNGPARICVWPGPLMLDLGSRGGRFSQDWHLFAEDWVRLPGDADAWPRNVVDGDRPVPVVERDGHPAVKLDAGSHALTGAFVWSETPASLAIAPGTGLLNLTLNGVPQSQPRLEGKGRLWLSDAARSRSADLDERLSVQVFRRLDDSLPLRVLTRLELQVSGGVREERLGPVTLPDGVPIAIESPLPARLGSDGSLRLEVRPGRWVVEVTAYHAGSVQSLARRQLPSPWPAREVWAFAAHPELRRVEIQGVESIDPRQTPIPDDWARLPIYLVGPEDRMRLVEQRRGDPDPGPDRLALERDIWLDFDGVGYSVRDRMRGDLNRLWRLDADSELHLGQVRVNGTPSLITRLDSSAPVGVEVRQGRLDLVADSRIEDEPGRLPASGWLPTLDQVRAHLHLPPGWDLLAVSGVDNDARTWLTRWTLLDLFLVLILTLGVGRLWGWGWGLLAWVGLSLTWHAPGAPQLVWLNLLAAAALLRLLPADAIQKGVTRLRWLVLWYKRLTLVALLVIGLPFLVSEVRSALYPQLERGGGGFGMADTLVGGFGRNAVPEAAPNADFEEILSDTEVAVKRAPASSARVPDPLPPPPMMDPKARIQTGEGVPDWHWNRFDLTWNGPVGTSDVAQLWLLTPTWNLVLSLLGCTLLILLGLRLAGIAFPRRAGRFATLPILVLGVWTAAPMDSAVAAEVPSPELLRELRARLLAPPDCLPSCLDLPVLGVRATPDRLTLELTLDAAVDMAAPVPGGGDWMPVDARLDDRPLKGMSRDSAGHLLVPLEAGRHRLRLEGPLPATNQLDLSLPLAPRAMTQDVQGWRLEGLDARGRASGQIRFVRLSEALSEAPLSAERELVQEALPPLIQVDRRLSFGLDWRVQTRVTRLSSPDSPIVTEIPLLPGESVQTQGLRVRDGRIQIALTPGQTRLDWSSRLEPSAELDLTATSDAGVAEVWHLDVGPIWHLDYEGLSPIHHPGEGRTLPTWRPLPGEQLRLRIVRPVGEPGPTLTIDRVDLKVAPGPRGSDVQLDLAVRSSQGGSHAIRLPEGAEPVEVRVDGRSLAVSSGTRQIDLPLVPGEQRMQVVWRDPVPLSLGFTPAGPDLGSTAVNLNLSLQLPRDRWVLFATGPRLGPAVLFWGVLLVLTVLSWGLGRSRMTPLRMHDWLLLGIGLALAEVWVGLLVAGWLFALGWRRRLDETGAAWRYNLTQVGLVLLTLVALAGLVGAVQQGLLGRPEMQITGNGSSGTLLRWYADRGGPILPEVWVLSVPMWVYRALMLGWALWLAFRLLDWLRWGWEGFAHPQLWRERKAVKVAADQTVGDRAPGRP